MEMRNRDARALPPGVTERQPNEQLIAHLGFPPPPHRIAGSRGPIALLFGRLALGFLLLVAIALPVSVMGFTSQARALATDTALGLGFGSPAPEVRASLRECDYYRSTGRYGSSGWDCLFELARGTERFEHEVELDGEAEAKLHRGAGIVSGHVGLYWPSGILLSRWLDYALLFVISGGLLYVCHIVRRMVPKAYELARAREASIRSVELLTRGAGAWFTFLDESGTRRYQQAEGAVAPLHLDALLTTGVALVGGEKAILLDAALAPLKLPEEQRASILARVGETFRAGMVRHALPPQPGDPATMLGRIERIEAELADTADPTTLARLYNDAWRLSWDNDDAALARRIFDARDAIALRLGPEHAWAALRQSREQFVPEGA
jgi:hypothetical protein